MTHATEIVQLIGHQIVARTSQYKGNIDGVVELAVSQLFAPKHQGVIEHGAIAVGFGNAVELGQHPAKLLGKPTFAGTKFAGFCTSAVVVGQLMMAL